MGFQDVAFHPSWASFSTTFPKNCGAGESLRTTTCLNTVVRGKEGHAACKIPSLQQSLFLVSVEFHGDHKTVTKLRWVWPPSIFGILLVLRQLCLSVCQIADVSRQLPVAFFDWLSECWYSQQFPVTFLNWLSEYWHSPHSFQWHFLIGYQNAVILRTFSSDIFLLVVRMLTCMHSIQWLYD